MTFNRPFYLPSNACQVRVGQLRPVNPVAFRRRRNRRRFGSIPRRQQLVHRIRHRRQPVFRRNLRFALHLAAQLRHAPASLRSVDQLLTQFPDDSFQLLRQPLIERRVFRQPLIDLCPYCVLHQ